MGLVFPLQPNLRKSRPEKLVLNSSSKRFTVGGTLLFIGLIIATMYLAAAPVFNLMWQQGNFLDRTLTVFFYGILVLYPLITLGCWFYKEEVSLEKSNTGIAIEAYEALGPIKWKHKQISVPSLESLQVQNWKGAVNVASLEASASNPQAKRYATKGHWMLVVNGTQPITLERRAQKEDIDWLKMQIDQFFSST